MAAPARFDLKLDKEDKELFSEAAALMGTSMAGFVRAAAKEKARSMGLFRFLCQREVA